MCRYPVTGVMDGCKPNAGPLQEQVTSHLSSSQHLTSLMLGLYSPFPNPVGGHHVINPPPPQTAHGYIWVYSRTHLFYISYNSIPLMGVYLNIRSAIPIKGMVH